MIKCLLSNGIFEARNIFLINFCNSFNDKNSNNLFMRKELFTLNFINLYLTIKRMLQSRSY